VSRTRGGGGERDTGSEKAFEMKRLRGASMKSALRERGNRRTEWNGKELFDPKGSERED